MKILLLIVFAALSFLPTVIGKAKVRLEGLAEGIDDGNGGDRQFGYAADEDIFGDAESVAEDVDSAADRYFTYEAADVKVEPLREAMPVEEESVMASERRPFDLRQAVVMQAVLCNRYIDEVE